MAYTKKTWKDRSVEFPRRYEQALDGEGRVTLVPAPGQVAEAGTPFSAENMNHIEQGIADLDQDLADHGHGNITKDGKVGTNPGLLLGTKTGGAIGAMSEAEAAALMKFSKPNILHNWDFTNPVNQRGVSGAVTNPGYFIDRWILTNGGVNINTGGGLFYYANSTIEQRIEGAWLSGREVTVSVQLADGAIKQATGIFPATTGDQITIAADGFGSVILKNRTENMSVSLINTGEKTVARVKCELGKISTLAFDPPADYGTEFLKCARYYYSVTGSEYLYLYGFVVSSTSIRAAAPLPAKMRITPTIAAQLTSFKANGGTYNVSFSNISISGNMAILTFSGSSLPANHATSSYIYQASFAADL